MSDSDELPTLRSVLYNNKPHAAPAAPPPRAAPAPAARPAAQHDTIDLTLSDSDDAVPPPKPAPPPQRAPPRCGRATPLRASADACPDAGAAARRDSPDGAALRGAEVRQRSTSLAAHVQREGLLGPCA